MTDTHRRLSIAEHVALACASEADKLGRPLTAAEQGCIRAGFHAGLLYHIELEVDGSFSRIAQGLAELCTRTIHTHEMRALRPVGVVL